MQSNTRRPVDLWKLNVTRHFVFAVGGSIMVLAEPSYHARCSTCAVELEHECCGVRA